MSSKDKIYQYLITHGNSATNAELAAWLRGQKGQLSIGQRLREIRQALQARGKDLKCAEERVGIYRYTIVEDREPPPPAQVYLERKQGQLAFI